MKIDRDSFTLWTVYDHPRDFPNTFVARRFDLDQPTGDVIISPDLKSLREQLAGRGLVPLARHPDDDPKIVEVWL